MAQGQIKKSKPATSSSSRRPNILAPKKGARTIAPKNTSLIKKKNMAKKLSSQLTARTERNLAQKAGHLEMLAGGKRDKKGKGGEGGRKERKG